MIKYLPDQNNHANLDFDGKTCCRHREVRGKTK